MNSLNLKFCETMSSIKTERSLADTDFSGCIDYLGKLYGSIAGLILAEVDDNVFIYGCFFI